MSDLRSPFRQDLLAGKVVAVTGGGSGINKGIAQAYGAHGARLVLMGRRQEVLDATATELTRAGIAVSVFQGDVRDPALCQAFIDHTVATFGQLDILINGAAGNFLCPPEDLSPNGFKTVIDIDLNGTFNCCRAAYSHLVNSKGLILNVSATLHYVGTPLQLHVSAAKAGVDALTRNLACEWGPQGIRVCGIAPGPIGDTEGMKRLAPGEFGAKVAATIPLGRMGRIDDIALAALFLASDAASFITGEVLVVDGGHWLAKPPMVPREFLKKPGM